MKNYNKILEAVNRGIQLALDDFDDEEQVQNIKSKQVQNRDYTKEYLDLMDEVVDLGLPSGTLWCKYNLGVDQNQLSKTEDWYGDYYAWGETEPNKLAFNWSNYKFAWNSKSIYLTKYTTREKYIHYTSVLDNLTQLQPEDDVAYQNKKLHNFKFYIPAKEQCEELINYTNNYWVNNYDPNKLAHNPKDDGGIQGLNGRIFEGKNENQLFIPATGSYIGSNLYFNGSNCYLCSSSLYLDDPSDAYCLYFSSEHINMIHRNRYCGYIIHPVINL